MITTTQVSLSQVNLGSKSDIANSIKKTDDKLKKIKSKYHLNKTKHLLGQNELDELSAKFKAISTKELTKDLINKLSILKIFFFQNTSKLFSIYPG